MVRFQAGEQVADDARDIAAESGFFARREGPPAPRLLEGHPEVERESVRREGVQHLVTLPRSESPLHSGQPAVEQDAAFRRRHRIDVHQRSAGKPARDLRRRDIGKDRKNEPDMSGQDARQPRETHRRIVFRQLVESIDEDDELALHSCRGQTLAEGVRQLVVLLRDRLGAAARAGNLLTEAVEQRSAIRGLRRRADEALDEDPVTTPFVLSLPFRGMERGIQSQGRGAGDDCGFTRAGGAVQNERMLACAG